MVQAVKTKRWTHKKMCAENLHVDFKIVGFTSDWWSTIPKSQN